MVLKAALVLMVHTGADVEDAIAALCLFATVAHALGELIRRDEAVEAAAKLTRALAAPETTAIGEGFLSK
jgi:hypothetical protein